MGSTSESNLQRRLKIIGERFLSEYPGGFSNPKLVEIGKKHQISTRTKQSQEFFSEDNFALPQLVVENMVKTISRSSLVSRFEKPRLRDWVKVMTPEERESFAFSLRDILHGDQEYGFNMMLGLLEAGRLAKWPLITILPYYYSPSDEVFVKPTTIKNIINYFELEELVYRPKPSYEFYVQYRKQVIEMRGMVDKSLQQDNAAFSGFLMMAI